MEAGATVRTNRAIGTTQSDFNVPGTLRRTAVPPELLEETLSCYAEHCRYLRSASVEHDRQAKPFPSSHGPVYALARGEFRSVPPWYIQDTGHFNSIELNLCYNQLSYVSLVACADALPWLSRYVQRETLQSKKLSDGLITSFESRFQKPMRAERFSGEYWVERIATRKGRLFARTGMLIRNLEGELCAKAKVAVVLLGSRAGVAA